MEYLSSNKIAIIDLGTKEIVEEELMKTWSRNISAGPGSRLLFSKNIRKVNQLFWEPGF